MSIVAGPSRHECGGGTADKSMSGLLAAFSNELSHSRFGGRERQRERLEMEKD